MNPITLPVAELKPALAGLGKIIGKRCTLPVLGCVRIERTREGRIELTGTDLDRTATVQLHTTDQGEPTTILVPLEDLANLANLAKSSGRNDTLVLTKAEDHKAVFRFAVAGQMLEHRCESLPVAEFPEMESVPGNQVVLNAALRGSIHDALACASTDATRLVLNGAYLDVSKPDGHYVVGTDGSHLFSSNSFTLALPESLILPTHPFLGWRGFNEDGDWKLRLKPATKDNAPIFELATEHWRYVSRSHDGNYPNWRQVVPAGRDFTGCIEIATESIDAVIQTITRLPDHDERYHAIGIETQNGRLQLLAKSEREQPWMPIEVPGAKASGKDVRTFVNRITLLKALRFGLTRIDFIDALSPLRLAAGGRQMIIMPVRVEGEAPATNIPPPASTPAAVNTNPPPPPAEKPKKEENKMPENNNGGAKPAEPNKEEPKPALDLAIAQIELVRGDFRNAVAGLNKLGDLLKQVQRENKASEKEISSVRATLRSLQSVRI